MQRLIAAALAVLVAMPAYAGLTDFNRQIDSTNFIVERGCSGTLISLAPPLVLTNYHCIQRQVSVVERDRVEDNVVSKVREVRLDPVSLEQKRYDGHELVGSSQYVADIVARVRNRDLAVVQARTTLPNSIYSRILPEGEEAVRGEEVWAVGNPAGLDATVTRGIVSSVSRTFQFPWADNEDLPMIQTDVGIFGGNSGGALYNSDGYLVGIPTAGHRQATHLGLAIPTWFIWEFLADNCLAEHVGGEDAEQCEGEPEVDPSELAPGEEGL